MPEGQSTRPTTDRVREAVFSALVHWNGSADSGPDEQFIGLSVLDLFAGSGAVGLEAASRGASRVDLVEAARPACQVITRNIAITGLRDRARVSCLKAAAFLAAPAPRNYDIIWLDPPYDLPGDQVDVIIHLIVEGGWLAADGVVVVERSSRVRPPDWPASLADHWDKRYGETQVYFAQPAKESIRNE